MKIQWLGHASFLIVTENGTRIITDPYESGSYGGGIGYGPIKMVADIVTISHDQHEDHNYTADLQGNFVVIKGEGKETVKGVDLKRVKTFHDATGGSERGENAVICIRSDGLNVVHLGDLGHVLTEDQVVQVGQPDVLLSPVGGTFTIGPKEAAEIIQLLKPRIMIPMHCKTGKCGFPLATLEEFVAGKPNVRRAGDSTIEIKAGNLPEPTEIVVLDHAL